MLVVGLVVVLPAEELVILPSDPEQEDVIRISNVNAAILNPTDFLNISI
jgi:hypothetical protein